MRCRLFKLLASGSWLLAPLFWLLFSGSWLLGSVDGVVMNITTGKPQPQVSVALVQPGAGGMQNLGTVTSDGEGKFSIDKPAPQGPALLQGTFKDVTYTLILQPGAPTTGLQMSVYDTTSKPGAAKMAQHIYIFEPGETDLRVNETFLIENDSNASFADPVKGSIQVYTPVEPKDLNATVEGTAGMSIRRQLEKTTQPGVYKLNYPIKPGEARVDVTYTIPLAEKYAWKILRTDGPTRIATPSGVTMTGTGIRDLGMEPKSQAHLYEVEAKAPLFEAVLKGSGTLRTRDDAPKEDDGSPKPEVIDARIYTRLPWVLGIAAGILLLGGTLLFRKGAA